MSNKLQEIRDGKYVQAWVAKELYPNTEVRLAISKFHNKLFNKQKRKFTDTEIQQIEIILK